MPWTILGSVHRCLPGQAAGTECVHKSRREGDWTKRSSQSKKAVGRVLLYGQHFKHLLNSILWLKFSIEILHFGFPLWNWAGEHLQGVATLGNTLLRLQLVYLGKKWEEGLRQ